MVPDQALVIIDWPGACEKESVVARLSVTDGRGAEVIKPIEDVAAMRLVVRDVTVVVEQVHSGNLGQARPVSILFRFDDVADGLDHVAGCHAFAAYERLGLIP